jgi:hypothetical protein
MANTKFVENERDGVKPEEDVVLNLKWKLDRKHDQLGHCVKCWLAAVDHWGEFLALPSRPRLA